MPFIRLNSTEEGARLRVFGMAESQSLQEDEEDEDGGVDSRRLYSHNNKKQ